MQTNGVTIKDLRVDYLLEAPSDFFTSEKFINTTTLFDDNKKAVVPAVDTTTVSEVISITIDLFCRKYAGDTSIDPANYDKEMGVLAKIILANTLVEETGVLKSVDSVMEYSVRTDPIQFKMSPVQRRPELLEVDESSDHYAEQADMTGKTKPEYGIEPLSGVASVANFYRSAASSAVYDDTAYREMMMRMAVSESLSRNYSKVFANSGESFRKPRVRDDRITRDIESTCDFVSSQILERYSKGGAFKFSEAFSNELDIASNIASIVSAFTDTVEYMKDNFKIRSIAAIVPNSGLTNIVHNLGVDIRGNDVMVQVVDEATNTVAYYPAFGMSSVTLNSATLHLGNLDTSESVRVFIIVDTNGTLRNSLREYLDRTHNPDVLVYDFPTAKSDWTMYVQNANEGFYVQCMDENGNFFIPSAKVLRNRHSITYSFFQPVSGKAYVINSKMDTLENTIFLSTDTVGTAMKIVNTVDRTYAVMQEI